MAEREGQQFGNFRLTRLLGKGAFAEVYLAVQIYLSTEAAIKVLHTQLANDAEIEKFRLEARTIAQLVHPNIVRLLDFGVQDNIPYLLMDYAPNGSLRQKFPGGQALAPEIVLPYIKQIAEALQYAHDQRLIHRDVKPENMLLGRSNEVLLSDFGIALVAQSTSQQQQTQGIAGTAAYMAPEQLQGKPRPASDQYALGVVAYEWLSGERPFNGTFSEVAGQHMVAAPPPLREKVPTLSPEVERVVLTTLAKDPKDRFASMRAFARALEQAILGSGSQSYTTNLQAPVIPAGPGAPTDPPQPSINSAETVISTPPNILPPGPAAPGAPGTTSDLPTMLSDGPQSGGPAYMPAGWAAGTPPPSPDDVTFLNSMQGPASAPAPTPPSRQGISRRTVLVAGAAGLALMGGASATAFLLLPKHTAGTTATPSPTSRATATRGTTPTATDTTTPTPNATASTPQPGDTLFTFGGHTQEVSSLSWSPSGRHVVSGSFDHTARVWDAINNQLWFTYTAHSNQIWAVAWSPDSNYIASGGQDRSVQIWDTGLNAPRSKYTGHSDAVSGIAWSPDSSLVASASYDLTVRVWAPISQQFHTLFPGHTDHVWAVDWSPGGSLIASGSKDKTVQVWNANNGSALYIYTGHSAGVSAVAWSPDGSRIASASYDNTVQVWNPTNGGNVVTYSGHAANLTSVAWSRNGQYIVSASKDGKVHVWNPSNGSRGLLYSKHNGSVDSVAWSPANPQIASAGADTSVQVWVAPS